MTRSRITAALIGLGLVAATAAPVLAQQQPMIVVPAPAPSASPTTVVPAPGGTTIVVPPGSTVTVTPPSATAVVAVRPWCNGAYTTPGGTNFGNCPGSIPR